MSTAPSPTMMTLLELARMTAISTPQQPIIETPLSDGIVSVMTTITPEYAAMLLENNHNNRSIDNSRVSLMVEEIKAGRWKENGESVIIAKTGRLLDGQHRCLAVVESGMPIRTILVFGVEDDYDVFATIDQGKNRSVANILETVGQLTNRSISATSRMLGLLTEGVVLKTKPQQADYLRSNIQEIAPWVEWARQVSALSPMIEANRRRMRAIGDVSLATLAVHMVREGADPNTVQEFFAGTIMELPTPVLRALSDNRMNILKLLNRRLKHGTALNRDSGSATPRMLTEFALYIRSYNRYVRDEYIGKLQITGEQFRYLTDLPEVVKGGKW